MSSRPRRGQQDDDHPVIPFPRRPAPDDDAVRDVHDEPAVPAPAKGTRAPETLPQWRPRSSPSVAPPPAATPPASATPADRAPEAPPAPTEQLPPSPATRAPSVPGPPTEQLTAATPAGAPAAAGPATEQLAPPAPPLSPGVAAPHTEQLAPPAPPLSPGVAAPRTEQLAPPATARAPGVAAPRTEQLAPPATARAPGVAAPRTEQLAPPAPPLSPGVAAPHTEQLAPPAPPLSPGVAPPSAAGGVAPPRAPLTSAPVAAAPARPAAPPARPALSPVRLGVVALTWMVVTVGCAALVAYLFGPLTQNREQRALVTGFRVQLEESTGVSLFAEDSPAVRPPDPGEPVAVLQIERLGLEQVVVEGTGPSQTQAAPGHVPGTGGLGQPGNSAVVGRRLAFGAPFRDLDRLRAGDAIIVSTVQGQSLYRAREPQRTGDLDAVYAASEGDQLTLVTSDETLPWGTGEALVVVADLEGRPFVPTPQGGLTSDQDGRSGDRSALGWLVVFGVLFVAVAAAATVLYQRWLSLSTYVLTTPALVALVVLASEAGTRLLPAWF